MSTLCADFEITELSIAKKLASKVFGENATHPPLDLSKPARDFTRRHLAALFTSCSLLPFEMIEVVCNDRLGKKVRVKCNEDDTIGDLKKLIAAQIGTRPEKLRLQKWYTVFKDHISLSDYEIHDGMNLELYYT